MHRLRPVNPLQLDVEHDRAHGRYDDGGQHQRDRGVKTTVSHADVRYGLRDLFGSGFFEVLQNLAAGLAQVVYHNHSEASTNAFGF